MKWNSLHRNDQWVAEVYDYKRNGSFVELGACSGNRISSCYVLEKKLDWYGVAVEPNSKYYKECHVSRKNPQHEFDVFIHTTNLRRNNICDAKDVLPARLTKI